MKRLRYVLLGFALVAVGCFRHHVDVVKPVLEGPVSVDLKINGSDGPVEVNGSPINVRWESKNATSCKITSPLNTKVALSDTTISVTTANWWYPHSQQSLKVAIACTDGNYTVTDSVIVRRPIP